jgi:hypothetical protein
MKLRLTTTATNSDSKENSFMKNTIDLPSSILLKCRFQIQPRNFIVNFCLENPNLSKNETVELFKLLQFKILPIYRTIIRFEKQEKVKRKIGSRKKCALSSSEVRAAS